MLKPTPLFPIAISAPAVFVDWEIEVLVVTLMLVAVLELVGPLELVELVLVELVPMMPPVTLVSDVLVFVDPAASM